VIPPAHARAVEAATGARVLSSRGIGGGDIAQASLLELSDGGRAFYKTARGGMFEAEARGLRALAAPGVIRLPRVLAVGHDFLCLEAIEPGRRGPRFFADFGRALARLHRHSAPHFGFDGDNFIGATPQPNPRAPAGPGAWAAWYGEHRIGHMTRLLGARGALPRGLARALAALEPRLPALLDSSDEPPSLLHGDLWGGNFLVDEHGAPVLIDPAVHYGHREHDLAMTRLFGGFTAAFHDAYQAEWPLPSGWRRRVPVYQLYHLLNHALLFGGGYAQQAQRAAEACLG
jgi:protein-ribulosamine 3-kinase